ncbi:MAG TPA: NADH-ubiquinone oxidoreductase, partial [Methanolinea sp.]|nr:NADH-ubiquinone oxidoreductase [Methanolinea sp.]
VLLMTFILVFIGSLPFWMILVAMILVTVSLSFVCALSPMLSPYDSVTIQTLIAGLMVAYVALLGVMS